MKVSVIIAVYNVEEYIERCLISVINQSEKNIEVIVVNDGSTDNTLKIIKDIVVNDNRITIINKKNQGLIEARKSGFLVANGEYILFLDGDDWLERNAVEVLINTAKNDKADVVIYNGFYSYDDKKIKYNTINNYYLEEIKKNPLKHLFLDNITPGIVYKFIKRDFIIDKKICFPYKISYAEDLAMVSNIFMHNPKISILDKNLYNYYQREGSISKSTDKILEVNNAILFIEKKLKEKGIYKEYEKEFEFMVFRHLFLSKILRIKYIYSQRRIVFKQYKEKKIKIKNNKYICEYLSYSNKNLKIRIVLYYFSYEIATLVDLLKGFIKKPILSIK